MSWRTEQSVDVQVSRTFAWQYWTNVENWTIDPAVESARLDGAFESGARGETVPRGGAPVPWTILEADENAGAVIEVAVPGVVARFTWRFDELGPDRARLTQTIDLDAEAGDDQAASAGAEFERGMLDGMRRLAGAMEEAARAGARRA